MTGPKPKQRPNGDRAAQACPCGWWSVSNCRHCRQVGLCEHPGEAPPPPASECRPGIRGHCGLPDCPRCGNTTAHGDINRT